MRKITKQHLELENPVILSTIFIEKTAEKVRERELGSKIPALSPVLSCSVVDDDVKNSPVTWTLTTSPRVISNSFYKKVGQYSWQCSCFLLLTWVLVSLKCPCDSFQLPIRFHVKESKCRSKIQWIFSGKIN